VKGSTSRLDYHLAVVETLALCAQGSNPAVELEVSALYTGDDLMEVLIDLDVRRSSGQSVAVPLLAARTIKAAFLRLYSNVYVATKMVTLYTPNPIL
ncbi:hypothetical protein T484DRAFT_1766384, partial [Baffinella frigidus]